jgi:A/G-specific adenine glycosylase
MNARVEMDRGQSKKIYDDYFEFVYMPEQAIISVSKSIPNPISVRRRLLHWYDQNGRDLPWRYKKDQTPDVYHVWLSEIMLAQTTVTVVIGFFDRFIDRWPRLIDLAEAELRDVLHAWQGLGYYARARNLHKSAQIIIEELGGRFPDTELALKQLPGVGDYTAAAIVAIGFNKPATPVDTNIERVTARLFALTDVLPKGRAQIREYASVLTPKIRPGDFAQALMDLGSSICKPKAPKCSICPLNIDCVAAKKGKPEGYPIKIAKVIRQLRHGMVFWGTLADGRVMLRLRPQTGLLGGMTEFPTTEWRANLWTLAEAKEQSPINGNWRQLHHSFSHFHLELIVLAAEIEIKRGLLGAGELLWCAPAQFSKHALPTLMKKVASHVADDEVKNL